jgi:glycosyltransferase involved in cell wall biosynthesis
MNTVLHILPTFDTGGLGSLGLAMIEAWPEKAAHLVVAPVYPTTKSDLLLPYAELVGGGNVVEVPRHVWQTPPQLIQALQQGIASVQRGRIPQNVIAYNYLDSMWSAQAARNAGFKGKVAAHVGTVLPDVEICRGVAQSPYAWGTKFVPASAAVRESLRVVGCPEEKIHEIVWNGVNLERFKRIEKERAAGAPLVFGFSGRMAQPAVKDWAILFHGFKQAAIPNSVLRIAGDGPMRKTLERMADGQNVEFVGTKSPKEMIEFLHGLDVFVMAALPIEGFSMALVEAIAAGCMIIGTDVPSVREVFEAANASMFLVKDAYQMGIVMRYAAGDQKVQEINRGAVSRLSPLLDSKRMAAAYAAIR